MPEDTAPTPEHAAAAARLADTEVARREATLDLIANIQRQIGVLGSSDAGAIALRAEIKDSLDLIADEIRRPPYVQRRV